MLRVHDVAAGGRLPRRARRCWTAQRRGRVATRALADELRCAQRRRLTAGRIPPATPLDSRSVRIAGRWPNATGAHRSPDEEDPHVGHRPLPRLRRARSPTCTRSRRSSSIDGYRRLRKAELIDAIRRPAGRRGGQSGRADRRRRRREADDEAPKRARDAAAGRRGRRTPRGRARRSRRRGRGRRRGDRRRARRRDGEPSRPRRRGRRGGRGRAPATRIATASATSDRERSERPQGEAEPTASARGDARRHRPRTTRRGRRRAGRATARASCASNPPEPSDDDVYVSAAQVKRCELLSGDRVGGPRRPPRRSERFPSLVRIDTINGRPADEVADGTRFDDLPAAFPHGALRARRRGRRRSPRSRGLAPIGKGSRVTIAGAARVGQDRDAAPAGARAAAATRTCTCCSCSPACGPRSSPSGSDGTGRARAARCNFAASADAQGQAVEPVDRPGPPVGRARRPTRSS